jgi:uncharacterized protein
MVEVRDGRLGRGVHATRAIESGHVVLTGWGERTSHRSRHSIQIDFCEHVVIDSPIQFLNHSCDPNCGVFLQRGVDSLEIHALRPIASGEELTIDYATFEYEIHFMPPPCRCESPRCREVITGYKDLPVDRRVAYGPYIAAFLHDLEPAVHRAG